MMKLRRLNESGIERFSVFLDSLTGDDPSPYPHELLTDPKATEEAKPPIEIESWKFRNRFEAAEYLFNLFKDSGLSGLHRDRGLWDWLALFYFDQLCPEDTNGRRWPGERARYLFHSSSRRYYKHLLAGPYMVYRLHAKKPEILKALLCGPLNEISDVYKEIVERHILITNPAIVEAVNRLYYDPERECLKKRVARNSPGGARRFAQVLLQFDCTWDLYSLSPKDIISLLPQEFDRFKSV